MKKLVLTSLFIALAIALGYSSTPVVEQQADKENSENVTRAYYYRDYYVGTLTGNNPRFTVHFTGDFLGCEGYISRVSGYTFELQTAAAGGNTYIGNVVTQQYGQVYVYRIYALDDIM